MAVVPAYGSQLLLQSSSVYHPVVQILDIDGLGINVRTTDTTHLGSPWATHEITGVKEVDDVTINFELDPADTYHIELEALSRTPSKKNWKIKIPAGTGTAKQYTFSGTLITYKINAASVDDIWKGSLTIKIDGAPAYATFA